jgi:CubicO group peptidase (beta-lactamase class C family)
MRTRRIPNRRALAGLLLVPALLAGACSGDDDGPVSDGAQAPGTTAPGGYPQSGPPGDPAPTIDRADVDAAIEAFGPVVEEAMAATGVPGVAVAVVHDDEVVLAEGYGVRELGTDEPVGPDTAFPIASLSKPVGSTVMASLVGDGTIAWDQPVVEVGPGVSLADAWVDEHLTFADLYSHRSGLPPHAGDLLEDLGYDRDEVLDRLDRYELSPFRATYAYTNFGMTAAAVLAAQAEGTTWEELSAQRLYEPLGMDATTSSHDEFMAREDRVAPHVRDAEGAWVLAPEQRDPDAQSPAGGVSSSADDLAQWLRLQLGAGTVDGEQLVDPDALLATHTPHAVTGPPRSPSARAGFYGLGWNVGTDDDGRTRFSHSGAFALGAATAVSVLPGEELAVVAITNGQPVGLPEALVESFVDLASDGEVSRDWVGLYGQLMEATLYPEPEVDYTTPPADPAPPRDLPAYAGTYESELYGPLEVVDEDGGLVLVVGPAELRFELGHFDGDTFWFTPTGENAVNPSDATFTVEGDGPATTVHIGWLDGEDEERPVGTFARP